ncbi:hypothetical protein Tco_0174883 [Tanacetum coccineum]
MAEQNVPAQPPTRTDEQINTMAEQNVPTQPPTRTDEQIVPRSQWLTIGKSNLLFNAQKIQKNPIFQISVDILSNTNFFQAFTASANVPAIYLQQFWNTMKYNEKTGVYSCQVDEQWFDLSVDLLRKALAITPVIPAHPFELPPSGDTVIDFVNELGYPEPVEIVSNIRVNYVYQPWRAIMSLINQCLTGKTSGSDKPRHPDPDIFLTQSKSQRQSEEPKEESNSSPHSLWTVFQGNLKFVPKDESVEVFGMAIPDPLITEAIQQSSYEAQQEIYSAMKKVMILILERRLRSMSLEPHFKQKEGEGDDADLEQAIKLSLDPAFLPQGRAPVGGVTIRDPVSELTSKQH